MSTTASALPYGPKLRDLVLGSFRGNVRRVEVPLLYRLGLTLLTLAMLLLPLVYLGLIAAVGYGVWYHAAHDLALLRQMGSKRGAAVAYFGPIVAGAILIVFMIKPLFARPQRPRTPRALARRDEPLLFAFVEEICRRVGAPMPQRIDVDCQVNASASFRRGWRSFFGQDLVLTIGLPLTAGLSLQQLAGVLAHEFGHFAQGAGMRLTYVIREISTWFARVVYERDQWDARLERHASGGYPWPVLAILQIARFCVWLSRRLLWVLMWLGNVLSSFMMRQMEFDADRYEARLVGAETFEQTCRELPRLGLGFQKSLNDLGASWAEGRLVESLPGLVAAQRAALPKELDEHLDRQIEEQATGWFDTHPADKDRIASARRETAEPAFRSELAARLVFRDFDGLAREVSRDFYEAVLEQPIDAEHLRSIDELLSHGERRSSEQAAAERYFQDTLHPLRPLPLAPPAEEAPDVGRTLGTLETARTALSAGRGERRSQLERFNALRREHLDLLQAEKLLDCDLGLKASDFGLPAKADATLVAERLAENFRQGRALEPALASFETLLAERLAAALSLARLPALSQLRDDAATLPAELDRLLAAAAALGPELEHVHEIHRARVVFDLVATNLQRLGGQEKLVALFHDTDVELHRRLRRLETPLGGVAYPFDHARGEVSLYQFLLPKPPSTDNPGELFEVSGAVVEAALALYYRILARLATIAEGLEAGLGLEPLAEAEPASQATA